MSVSVPCGFLSSISGSPNFTKFYERVARDGGSFLLWHLCSMSCASGFVDDVRFSYCVSNAGVATVAASLQLLRFVDGSG